MPSKNHLQTTLKEKHGINKNITQSLSLEDCQSLLILLNNQSSAEKLVESFIEKNHELSRRNQGLGQQRYYAEKKLKHLQAEYQQLEASVAELEKTNAGLGDRKTLLSQEQQTLQAEVQQLTQENQRLGSEVNSLAIKNDELVEANDQLKRDNKDLKNIVDQIRLRLAHDTKMLLQYEDSEIRKALIRLFRWTLG